MLVNKNETESGNGMRHLILTLSEKIIKFVSFVVKIFGYKPGLYTAFIIFLLQGMMIV